MSRVWGTFWEDPEQLKEFRFTRRQLARAWRFAKPYRPLLLVYPLVAMAALSPAVTLAVCLLIPLLLVPAEFVGRRMRRINKELMKRWGAMEAATAERFNISGALLVKLFGRYDRELTAFGQKAAQIRTAAIQTEMLGVLFGSALGLAGSLAVVAIYWMGGLSVIAGGLTLGTVVALATLAQRVYGPAVDLASTRISLAAGLVSFERVFEVLDAPHAISERPGAVTLAGPRGEVVFEDVWFRYPAPATYSIASLEAEKPGTDGLDAPLPTEPSDWILRGISLHAAPGTMTALVGHSGAGKTTLSNLVPRLYDSTRGRVLMDGRDVRDLTLDSLAGAVGMVPQDPHLFH